MKGFLCMGFPGSLGGTTLQTLKLAAVLHLLPIFFPTTTPQRPYYFPIASSQRLSLPRPSFFELSLQHKPHFKTPQSHPKRKKCAVSKPQWRAAIDFKWIRDNRDAVASNINNRNSNVHLELALDLYDKSCTLQKSH